MFKYFYYTLLLLIFPICIFPQRRDSIKTYQLSDIVISATRTENSIMELANSITIIDSAEIARRNKTTVFDLLKEEYGLSFTQDGGANKLSYIYTRGANSNHTLVLIDGVEANMPSDPGNSYDFSFLPPDNIERIEILRGPQSPLYGSDAMAGVINIITKKGDGGPNILLTSEGGSYRTYRGTAGLNGSADIFNYSVSLSRFKTMGFSSASTRYGNSERDGSDNYNLSSRFGLDLDDILSFNFFYRFSKGSSDYDQWGGLHGDDPTYIFNMEEGALRGEAALSLFDGIWKLTLGGSFFRNVRRYSFDSTTYNTYSSRSLYDGRKVNLDWQNNIQVNSWNLFTLGIESVNESANSEYYYGTNLSLFPDKRTYTTGIYLQDQIKTQYNFFTTVGVRFDKHNLTGEVTTYRIAPAYIIPETGTKLKLTYGTAFHSPSLFNLYDPAYGNPLLKPERNKGWDAGIEQNLYHNNISLGITYFNNQFEDLFGYDNNFKTINIDKAETYGIEFFSTTIITAKAKLKFNYTYTKATELEGPDKGEPLLRRPKDKIDFILFYNISHELSATAELTYLSKRDDEYYPAYVPVRVTLPGYAIVNLSASYDLYSYMEIYGRVDNLFNTYYEEVYGYGTAGLSGYLGFKLNF
ncbi:MAG: TonB-dependent receptor [Ignavibacteriaceae bacterium]|nr:TonB-dependent receptor [Ignavibacteriaceae bacterium]